MFEENKNIYISYWLLLITILIGIMIIIGGLTRLTDSGLSITRWDLISGIIPPLNETRWQELFSLYKKIPEYKLLNSSMTLDEFKIIYWWEYVHRLLGRIIGLFYLIPLLYFTYKKTIRGSILLNLYLIFFLICFQGFIGWYMVTSGLTENTDVSHYRLSLHLTIAFIIFILSFWNYLKYSNHQNLNTKKKLPQYIPIVFVMCLLLQISIGALVSGLDAGQIYKSWPMMDQNYFPDDSSLSELFLLSAFENPSLVQFFHRNIAYLIILFFIFIAYLVFRDKDFSYLRKIILSIFLLLFLQIVLGILTVLSGSQIHLASMHQIGSIILVSASLIFVFKNSKS